MSHIFISYSRKDLVIAEPIITALSNGSLKPWIDWKNIPKGEEFKREIYEGIEKAEVFLFLVSPASVKSSWCETEIDYATDMGKRIIPIVIRNTRISSIPMEISKRNWIFCRAGKDVIENSIQEIRKTIDTDYPWLKFHTELQLKALKWEQGKDPNKLLRENELGEAESKLANINAGSDPQPTTLQHEYLYASRRKEEGRQRRVISTLTVGVIILAIITTIAWIQRNEAQRQTKIALAHQLAAQADSFANKDPELSLLLSVEALQINLQTSESRLPVVENALRGALSNIGGSPLGGTMGPTAFSPNNKWLVTYASDHSIQLWDLSARDPFTGASLEIGKTEHLSFFKFSEDSRWLVGCHESYGNGLIFYLWDLSSEKPNAQNLRIETDYSNSRIIFSPDNRWLVIDTGDLASRKVSLWDLSSQNAFEESIISIDITTNARKTSENSTWFVSVEPVFSADSRWLITADGDDIQIWDLVSLDPSGAPLRLDGHNDVITGMTVTADNHWLITSGWDSRVVAWDLTSMFSNKDPIVFNADDPIKTIAISADNHWLVGGDTSGRVYLWDFRTKQSKYSAAFQGGNENVDSILIDPKSHWIVVIDSRARGYVWSLSIHQPVGAPMKLGSDDCIHSAMFSHNGRWLITNCGAVSVGGRTSLYDLNQPLLTNRAITLSCRCDSVSLSPDDRWLITNGSPLRLWRLNTVNATTTPMGGLAAAPLVIYNNENEVYGQLAFSPDGQWLFAASMTPVDEASIFRLHKDQLTFEISIEVFTIKTAAEDLFDQSFSFSPSSKFLITDGGISGNALVWKLDKLTEPPLVLKGHVGPIASISISPNEEWIATSGENSIVELWSVSSLMTNSPIDPILLKGFNAAVTSTAFSPNGALIAAGSRDDTVLIWDLSTLGEQSAIDDPMVLSGNAAAITSVAFSSNSRWLAAGSEDGTVLLWDSITGDQISTPRILRVDVKTIDSVAFTNNNQWLVATGYDPIRTIFLWDISSWLISTTPMEFRVASFSNPVAAISPDSQWLATGDENGTAQLWSLGKFDADTRPSILPGHFTGLGLGVSSVAFDSESRWLATSGEDGSIRLWQVKSEDLIETACKTASRNLTQTEWVSLIGDVIPYRKVCPNLPLDPESTIILKP